MNAIRIRDADGHVEPSDHVGIRSFIPQDDLRRTARRDMTTRLPEALHVDAGHPDTTGSPTRPRRPTQIGLVGLAEDVD